MLSLCSYIQLTKLNEHIDIKQVSIKCLSENKIAKEDHPLGRHLVEYLS